MSPGPNQWQVMITALLNIQQYLMHIDRKTAQLITNSSKQNTLPGGLGPGSIKGHPGGFFGNFTSGITNGILNQIAPSFQALRGQIAQIMSQTYSKVVANPRYNPNLPTGPGNQPTKTIQQDISMAKLGQVLSLVLIKGFDTVVSSVKSLNDAVQNIGSGGRNRIQEMRERYGQFSPSMQNSIVRYEFANMMRQMKSGEELAPSFDDLVKSQMELDDSTRSLKVAFEKWENKFWTGVNNMFTDIVEFFQGDNKRLRGEKEKSALELSKKNELLEKAGLLSRLDETKGMSWRDDPEDAIKWLKSNQKAVEENLQMLNQQRDIKLNEKKDTSEIGKEIRKSNEQLQAILELIRLLGGKADFETDSAQSFERKMEIARGQHLERKKARREQIRKEHNIGRGLPIDM